MVDHHIWSHVMKVVNGENGGDVVRSLCSTLQETLRVNEEDVNECLDWFDMCTCP